MNGDGCDSNCAVEAYWSCTLGDSTSSSVCIDVCGDGKVMPFIPSPTYCDDGGTTSGDGCSSSCTVEPGWSCSRGGTTTASTCSDK